jgi:tRNA-2-methylthio-N6-dimethylallyladenosine synthase
MKFQTYYIESFGCQMNLSDSERIAGQLETLGYVHCDQRDNADVIVINTCCVRESAENRIFGHIGALKHIKEQKPATIIIVAGCLAQKDQQQIFRRAPHVNIVLGTQNIDRLAEILQESQSKKRIVESGQFNGDGLGPDSMQKRHQGVSAWIPIMYGCDNYCSYCIVPYVRGAERSRPFERVLDEVQSFALAGGQEITLLGQNVNSYGKNLPGEWDFPRLLQQVDLHGGIRRIRFMTSHPKDFGESLIEVMARGKNICEHLHLPVQSGCDEILRRMNRNYSTGDYRRHLEQLRAAIPQISVTTDIIVGFPGETDEMFEQTLAFVAEMKFDSAYTFLYSKRSGTPAAAMENQVPLSVKKERLQRLMDLQNSISLQANQQWVGQSVEVLADGPSKTDPAVFSGRTRQNRIVLWSAQPDDLSGLIRRVAITSAQTFLLRGDAVTERTE